MTHNPIRPWRDIERRKSRQIMVGNVPVGGDAPIAVQTMTNTDSSDVKATLAQVLSPGFWSQFVGRRCRVVRLVDLGDIAQLH